PAPPRGRPAPPDAYRDPPLHQPPTALFGSVPPPRALAPPHRRALQLCARPAPLPPPSLVYPARAAWPGPPWHRSDSPPRADARLASLPPARPALTPVGCERCRGPS